MVNNVKDRNPMVVKLEDNIKVSTLIPQEQHAALRSGFMGHPVNPRWTVDKYCAWKMGRQLRQDFQNGKLVIRDSDSSLVPVSEVEKPSVSSRQPSTRLIQPLSTWTQTILTAFPLT